MVVSDESSLMLELDGDGRPIGRLARDVPQAEGLVIGDDGTLYVVSESNFMCLQARRCNGVPAFQRYAVRALAGFFAAGLLLSNARSRHSRVSA